jgi:DNA-binding NarL/FixJ family response regulator
MERVMVVDDHGVVAELLADAIGAEPEFEAVGCARGVAEARDLVEKLSPDVVIMDVRLGDGDGIAATAEFTERDPKLRVVIFTAIVDQELVHRAAAADACALLPKDGDMRSLLEVLRTARRGSFTVHPRLLHRLVGPPEDPEQGRPALTPRELDVLRMLSTGLGATQIAREMDISLHTCRGHVKSLLSKLDAHSQLEAVAKAVRLGLVNAYAQR